MVHPRGLGAGGEDHRVREGDVHLLRRHQLEKGQEGELPPLLRPDRRAAQVAAASAYRTPFRQPRAHVSGPSAQPAFLVGTRRTPPSPSPFRPRRWILGNQLTPPHPRRSRRTALSCRHDRIGVGSTWTRDSAPHPQALFASCCFPPLFLFHAFSKTIFLFRTPGRKKRESPPRAGLQLCSASNRSCVSHARRR